MTAVIAVKMLAVVAAAAFIVLLEFHFRDQRGGNWS